ncbi:MAG: glycosyltransferase [Candidatus Atribacteria bacterium]
MNILFSYGYHPRTTGFYLEKVFSRDHQVTYCGPPYKFERSGFSKDVDLSKIDDEKWDLFFYIDAYHAGFPFGIEKTPFPTACYLIDIPYNLKQRLFVAPFFDYVFIPHKEYLEIFRQLNKNVFWLPFACDPEVHRCHKNVNKIYDIGFVGGVKGEKRGKILENLSKHFKLNDFKRFHEPSEMALVYSQSKIVFNMGREGELNMRFFEALSSGSLLLTERSSKNGSNELFKNGEHLVEYEPKDNLKEIIKYYLIHDRERKKIAEAGHKLVREKHTYWHRVQTILKIIKEDGCKMNAPMRTKSKGQVFLGYEKVYSEYIMVDSACELFAHTDDIPLIYKIKSLYYIIKTFLKRFRQLGWSNLTKRYKK